MTSNRAGQVHLEVSGAGRSGVLFLPLVAVDVGGDRSRAPEFLRLLADQVESWSPQRSGIVRELRGQADHLAAGGAVRSSPLARRLAARGGRA